MHIQAISYFPLQLFTDQTPSGLVLSSIPSGATHAVQGALRQQRNISLSSMRQRRPRVYPGRASAQRERRAWKRLLGFVALIAATVALPVLLTLRGNGGGSSGSSGSTNDNAFFAPRDADLEARDDWDASHWRGIAKSIPRVPRSQLDIHVVFSTDCSLYQNYQSILLFQSAEMAGQGPVTRVASGCTAEEENDLRAIMAKQPERFRVHFTPDYSRDVTTGEQFLFYNKPNGMAHFLKFADPPVNKAVIALVDPDMVFVSKLTPYVGNQKNMIWHDAESERGPDWVVEGQPVAQYYGLGGIWAAWTNLKDITAKLGPNSPANEIGKQVAVSSYPVGPPYLLHPRDWARVIKLWVAMCPEVYARHPGILAEMYGYCIGAAHIGLRHRVAYGLMVSDPTMEKEGWPMVDSLKTRACDASAIASQREHLPPLLHYCQMYRVGTYMYGKRHKNHHHFFSCGADAFQEPPAHYLESPMGKVRIHPGREEPVTADRATRQGYMMCSLLRYMNLAQAAFKQRYCSPDEISGDVWRFTDLKPKVVAADQYG